MGNFWILSSAFLGAGLCIGFGAIGAAIGEGIIAGSASRGISRQPAMSGEILKMMLISQAVTESSAIFALVIAILLLFQSFSGVTFPESMALIGAGLCMGMGALGAGIGSGLPGSKACESIARNPNVSNKIMTVMLIGQAVDQTPTIFALFVSLILLFIDTGTTMTKGIALISAGLCMGVGAIGSGIGCGFPGGKACESISRNPGGSNRIITAMLIGQAVDQTPTIFALFVSLILLFIDTGTTMTKGIALISAGLCMGVGAIGSGIGCGFPGGKACESISRNPGGSNRIITAMLIGQAVDQTPTIFALFVSLLLLFMNFSAIIKLTILAAILGAGISTGFGAIGPGIGGGITAAYAIEGIGKNIELYSLHLRTMLIGQAVSQSTSIYAMVISLVLLFVVK